MIEIKPYKSVGPIALLATDREQCERYLGEPEKVWKNHEGVTELHYQEVVVRLDSTSGFVHEVTLLPNTEFSLIGMPGAWSKDFVRALCAIDEGPLEIHGFLVMLNLGLAVTGIQDDESADSAITVFARGAFDDLMEDAVPFDWRRM